MDENKLTKREQKLLDLALKGGTDKELAIQEQINELEDKFDESVKNIKETMPDINTVLKTVKGQQGEKGDKGDTGDQGEQGETGPQGPQGAPGRDGRDGVDGLDGKDGKDGVDGKIGPQGETGPPGQDGSPDTPEQVVDKVNQSKNLINPEKIKGLADIERMAKANAEFNPAMGPSFADLKNITDSITKLSTPAKAVTINYIIDGGGSALTTGVKGFVEIPYNMTITGWEVFADQSGSVVVDVWRSTYAGFPPVIGGTIAGSELPTLSSQQVNQNLALSTWTTALNAGDILAYNVNSASTVTRITVSLIGVKN